MWTQIAEHITQSTGKRFESRDRRSVSGGCINQGYRVTDGAQTYFVKLNQASQVAMFAAEALGLEQMRETETILVPAPICWGTVDKSAYIVLEWLDLGRGTSQTWEEMGRQLARLHQVKKSTAFGWERDNTIGATPQINTWTSDWCDFFTRYRIGYQLQLAQQKGGHFPQGDRLLVCHSQTVRTYASACSRSR